MKNLACHPRAATAAVLRAQSHALRAQSQTLETLADALEQTPGDQPPKYVDQDTAYPLTKRVYLSHARHGAFPTRRVGKRVLVDTWGIVTSPFDPDVLTQAETLEEAFENARDVIALFKEDRAAERKARTAVAKSVRRALAAKNTV